MAEPERIYNACAAVLDAVVNHHGGDLPARRLVSAGAPAWDCELVAVWCERTAGYSGNPSTETTERHQGAPGWAMRVATVVASIVRCTPAVPESHGPTVKLTTVEQEQAAARALYGDAQRMQEALLAAVKADELPGCHSLVFLDWRTVGPEGGLVGGELRIRLGLVRGA